MFKEQGQKENLTQGNASHSEEQAINEAMRNIRTSMQSDNNPDTDVLDLTERVEEQSGTNSNFQGFMNQEVQQHLNRTASSEGSSQKTSGYNINRTAQQPSGDQGQLNSSANDTLESIVLKALRPQLQMWLDENLPRLVEKSVEKEMRNLISKITK